MLLLAEPIRLPVGWRELIADGSRLLKILLIVGHAGEGRIYGSAFGTSRLIAKLRMDRKPPTSSCYQLV